MKGLYSYICESSSEYNIGANFTVKDCIDQIGKNKSNLGSLSSRQLEIFLNYLYQLWEQSFQKNPNSIPCRFAKNNNIVKIKRDYKIFMDQIRNFCDNSNIDFEVFIAKRTEAGFYLGGKKGLKFIWGDGSFGGSRSKKGLDYEVILKNNIINFVKIITGDHPVKSEQDLKSILGDSFVTYNNIIPIYLAGGFNKLIEGYIKCGREEYLRENISLTGKKGTKRNSRGEIFDLKELKFGDQNIETVLRDSGEIIADLIIIPDKTYISAKIESAQLSGVSLVEILNNDTFDSIISGNENKGDIKIKKIKTFIQDLGIDFDSLVDSIRNKTGKLDVASEYDKSKLGSVFQKLVGGNYWYTNPKKSIFVPAIDAKLKFNATQATISKSGKTIHVKGNLDGVPAEIEYRVDGSGYIYPHRIFPIVDVEKLISKL